MAYVMLIVLFGVGFQKIQKRIFINVLRDYLE